MPYFQNVFDQEFRGTLIGGDRQYTLNFNLKGNINTSTLMMCYVQGPYNLSTNNTLTINYAIDPTLKQFQALSIDVAGANPAVTQAWEVAAALNANPVFSALWKANTRPYNNTLTDINGQGQIVYMRAHRPTGSIKAYISNTGAEEELHFNANAPIGQLPTYFSRHSIPNALAFTDSYGMLLPLDPTNGYIQSIITAQGQNPSVVLADWQLLTGRSGMFNFTSQTFDGSGRVSTALNYAAGAVAGDLAMQTLYTYTGSNTTPTTICQVPYTLATGDLITDP